MKIALVAVALATVLPVADAVGQTAQDRQACTADVMRLCASAIPNRAHVIACVLRNQSRLGSECRAVVVRYTAKSRTGSEPTSKPDIEHTVSLR
jgi:hypothetical protein